MKKKAISGSRKAYILTMRILMGAAAVITAALVLFLIADFSRRNTTAAWLSAPYLLWLLFAAYLNLGIWLLNR